MSLDVYLSLPGTSTPSRTAIFIREDGATREITAAEWTARHPDREPVTCTTAEDEDVYHGNVTHNLAPMARAAGLYDGLWRPDDHSLTTARQLIPPLRTGLARLVAEHEAMRLLNPINGWGTYEGLVRFTTDYLAACERWPEAMVRVWR